MANLEEDEHIQPSEHSSLLDHHHHDPLHHSSSRRLDEDVPLYARPRQRQRWDDTQIQPHVNWGDLFWDLFYVSAAFNLAAALKESLNGIGLLYFVSCYLPVLSVWLNKVAYDARYAPEDNLYHRGIEILHLIALATIVQHIRPVESMADANNNPTMMLFSLGLTVEYMLWFFRQYEIYRKVDGGPEATHNGAYDMRRLGASLVCYGSAFALSAYRYFTHDEQEDNSLHGIVHAPMLLCLVGYFVDNLYAQLDRIFRESKGRSHKELFVPLNVEFTLHRIGEWVMLMLGESVLALLIVEESSGRQYYITFYGGIVTVTAFQYLFFRSQPFEADDHAMRRSQAGGILYGYGMTVYSGALILVGCSYKMILHYYLDEQEGNRPTSEEAQAIANLFCWSMAVSFVTLDLMIMSHRGFFYNMGRHCEGGRCHYVRILVSVIDWTLVATLASLSQFITNLETLSVCGLVIVMAQLLLHTLGLRFFPVSKKSMHLCSAEESRTWPNTSVPQSHDIVH